MKVYLEPDTNSRGILRVRDALIKYAPKTVEVVQNDREADLIILHVYGRHDGLERRINKLKAINKPYVMIQYALRSTQYPSTRDWVEMWNGSKFVWSYYNLKSLCGQDSTFNNFDFYYAPLGVDSEVFQDRNVGGYRYFEIAACSQHALAEGARECSFAVKRVGGKMFFLGHELRRGPDIQCFSNLTDFEVSGYFSGCKYVSGLRRVEGFEFPVIEGALCGARPIVFDRPEMRKWFGDFAIFIPEGTRDQVVDHLESIFKEKIPLVTEEEKARIKERFNWIPIINNFWKKIL